VDANGNRAECLHNRWVLKVGVGLVEKVWLETNSRLSIVILALSYNVWAGKMLINDEGWNLNTEDF
jgi:hypothetical protein